MDSNSEKLFDCAGEFCKRNHKARHHRSFALQQRYSPTKPCFSSRLWPVPDFTISAPPANSYVWHVTSHCSGSAYLSISMTYN